MRPGVPELTEHEFRDGKYKITWRAPRRPKNLPQHLHMYGLCCFNRKRLWIYPSIDAWEFLDTILDETTHANYPDLDDESVRDGVKRTISFLKKVGMKVSF